jgi:hypothetical protein
MLQLFLVGAQSFKQLKSQARSTGETIGVQNPPMIHCPFDSYSHLFCGELDVAMNNIETVGIKGPNISRRHGHQVFGSVGNRISNL